MNGTTSQNAPRRASWVLKAILVVMSLAIVSIAALEAQRGGRAAPDLNPVRARARARDFEGARRLLAKVLKAHPNDGPAHRLMAELATEPDDPRPELALAHVAAMRPRDNKEAALARFFEGKAQFQRKRYGLAETAWAEALRLDPTVPEAGWALLDLLDKEGRVKEAHALGMRLQAIEPDPLDRAQILLEMTRIDIDLVAPGSQVALFGSLAKEHPENLQLALTFGRALIGDSRGAEGLEVLEEALRRYPNSADAWGSWLFGLDAAFRIDRLAEEFARLPVALRDDPRFAKFEGFVAQNQGDWPRAARAFRRAAAYEPYNGNLTYRLRGALRKVGATEELERVHRWYTSFEEAFKAMRGAYDEAIKVPTLGAAPHVELYHRLAELRERMGRPDEARAWHRITLNTSPNDPVSLAALKRLE